MRGSLSVKRVGRNRPAERCFKPYGRPTPGGLPATTISSVVHARRREHRLSDGVRERPDAQQELRIVLAAKVGLFLEVLVIGELGSQITGK